MTPKTEEIYLSLRSNVNTLGCLLGEVIARAEGKDFLGQIEEIRNLSKDSRGGSVEAWKKLKQCMAELGTGQMVPVARAFGQFLNLANIADQHHITSREMDSEMSARLTLENSLSQLVDEGHSTEAIASTIDDLNIELVLTAHPTEITRRSLIHKYSEIEGCLNVLELKGLTQQEIDATYTRLRNLITQIWYSNDFREARPTPVDEAVWGFAVIENSLWKAVPEFLRRLDKVRTDMTGEGLALDSRPVSFASWMGGDRDGNPNVTAEVTRKVLLLSRWQAADLFYSEVDQLIKEFSMTDCNAELRAAAGEAREPYRAVLRNLRMALANTKAFINEKLDGGGAQFKGPVLEQDDQLLQPLLMCYHSLVERGMEHIANNELLDLIRRAYCFGIHLVKHDIRQDSARHLEAFSEITRTLNVGDYATWPEQEKQTFLIRELSNNRPLFPRNWSPSPDVQEVLETCRVAAEQSAQALSCYVISMASQPSDVLAVKLLLKECGCAHELPVAPLFETLDDLQRAPVVIQSLLDIPGFKELIDHKLMVMIGYSDSAKDAGVLAASWAQYRAQEALVDLCNKESVSLTLFHGRGGTIGRGGAPARAALLSQPPGSLIGGLRVTEQGEMIRAKLGAPSIAVKTLALYSTAILRANLSSPPVPDKDWRILMDELAEDSCARYREFVQGNARFVEYFRQATPEQELANLPLGSRPSRRKGGGGIESLRAIPWIFAWSQNRLMLPAWLGAGAALHKQLEQGRLEKLRNMASEWPFFSTRLSMLEMVSAKTDLRLSEFYDQKLVDDDLKPLGQELRAELKQDVGTLLEILGHGQLLETQEWVRESIELRNIYTDPLNVLQAELLQRSRYFTNRDIEHAVMVTIAGIAAGLRNTG